MAVRQKLIQTFLFHPFKWIVLQFETGDIDDEKLKENLESAADVYINRCNGYSCGDAVIHLFKGANTAEWQTY